MADYKYRSVKQLCSSEQTYILNYKLTLRKKSLWSVDKKNEYFNLHGLGLPAKWSVNHQSSI